MAQLPRLPQGPQPKLASDDNAAADARPDGEEGHGVDLLLPREGELRQGGRADIVDQEERAAEAGGEGAADIHAGPLLGQVRE